MTYPNIAILGLLFAFLVITPLATVKLMQRKKPSATRSKLLIVAALSSPLLLTIPIVAVLISIVFYELGRTDPESLYDVPQRTFGILVVFVLPTVWMICAPIELVVGALATRSR